MICETCGRPVDVPVGMDHQLSIDTIRPHWRDAIAAAKIAPQPNVKMPLWAWENLYHAAVKQEKNDEN